MAWLVNCLISIGVAASRSSSLVSAQPVANQVDLMSQDAFTLSIKQAALTVCALRKSGMDYKLALKTSAIPVFQLVKFNTVWASRVLTKSLKMTVLFVISVPRSVKSR